MWGHLSNSWSQNNGPHLLIFGWKCFYHVQQISLHAILQSDSETCKLAYFILTTVGMLVNQNSSKPAALWEPHIICLLSAHFPAMASLYKWTHSKWRESGDDVIRQNPAPLRQETRRTSDHIKLNNSVWMLKEEARRDQRSFKNNK